MECHEVLDLERAVGVVTNMTDGNSTLVVVTADYIHTLSISGYPARGRDILGTAWPGGPSILGYASGPGAREKVEVVEEDVEEEAVKLFPALGYRRKGSHGGDDVPVYVRGPGSAIFGGNIEQSFIPHLLGYSACLGPGAKHQDC